ncbi:MAG TPA: ShlB/FhaC/HecB family hemolysin secretion/activation protein [Micropepsaceae bacterium]|nr:ShlB/FhaC/HecB family hemolysin secretion/activation protein [Micropepsaceae bacterium]
MTSRTISRAILFAAGILALSVSGAFAQNILPPQILDPAVRTAQPPAQARTGDILAAPAPGACPLESSDLKFRLESVEFRGAADLPPEILAPAYQGLTGKDIPVSAICRIRDRAGTILFQRGLLARVEVPEQTIMDGHLVFDVIEAYVAAIQLRGDAGPAQQKVEDYIEMLRGLRPFDINKAQRYLLLAGDIPGITISATLRPSPQGRGAVELDVLVSRIPSGMVISANNLGAKSTGRLGALIRADFNSLTRYGEHTTLVAYSTFDGNWREQHVLQAVEEARFGADGLVGRMSLAYGTTHPGDILAPLDIAGKSFVGDFRLAYPVVRSRSLNVALTGGFDYIFQDIDIGPNPLTRDRLAILVGRLAADKAWSDLPVTLGGGLELRQGMGASLGGSHTCVAEASCFLSRFEGHPDALVTRADGRFAVQWSPYIASIAAFQAQYSNVPLLAFEEFAAGGLTIGRGYDPSVLSGDSGIGGSFEIRVGQFAPGFTFFGFFDTTRIWNKDTGSANRTLRSTGAGIELQLLQRLHIQALYAAPLDKVSSLLKSKAPGRIMFSVSLGF